MTPIKGKLASYGALFALGLTMTALQARAIPNVSFLRSPEEIRLRRLYSHALDAAIRWQLTDRTDSLANEMSSLESAAPELANIRSRVHVANDKSIWPEVPGFRRKWLEDAGIQLMIASLQGEGASWEAYYNPPRFTPKSLGVLALALFGLSDRAYRQQAIFGLADAPPILLALGGTACKALGDRRVRIAAVIVGATAAALWVTGYVAAHSLGSAKSRTYKAALAFLVYVIMSNLALLFVGLYNAFLPATMARTRAGAPRAPPCYHVCLECGNEVLLSGNEFPSREACEVTVLALDQVLARQSLLEISNPRPGVYQVRVVDGNGGVAMEGPELSDLMQARAARDKVLWAIPYLHESQPQVA